MALALRRSGKMEADVFLYNNNFVIKEKSKKSTIVERPHEK